MSGLSATHIKSALVVVNTVEHFSNGATTVDNASLKDNSDRTYWNVVLAKSDQNRLYIKGISVLLDIFHC